MEDGRGKPAFLANASAAGPVVLVCEHASNYFPAALQSLGLSDDVKNSHVAWDPGAFEVAVRLATLLDARLVASGVSRLVFDCNRPPSAPDAIPVKSEVFGIPGNAGLSEPDRAARVQQFYTPFRDTLAGVISGMDAPVLITIHSFTPVYLGHDRKTDIGVLHDSDSRVADRMLGLAGQHTDMQVERNQPYGPQHGVTHTLKEHAIGAGLLNVMLEIRNDLINSPYKQDAVAGMLAGWLTAALEPLGVTLAGRDAACQD